MADSTPNPALHERTSLVGSEHVDAFISHSWQDDVTLKWAALQLWRTEFVATHDREPRVWIDKCCIDQTDIDSNLMCLPVFLAQCDKLLILCGNTYLKRIWCVLEMFVFLEMGKSFTNVTLLSLEIDGTPTERFEDFEVNDANCYRAEDRDKLLSILETGPGGLQGFNCHVRSMLRSLLQKTSKQNKNKLSQALEQSAQVANLLELA